MKTGICHKPSVLVVDNIDLNAAVLTLALQQDYRVLVASDGREAVRYLKKCMPIQAVITDIQMPVMNGMELITYMKNHDQYKEIPIFVNTLHPNIQQENQCKEAGVEDFFSKTDTPLQICSRLEGILAKTKEN